jgi:hypothetical protein
MVVRYHVAWIIDLVIRAPPKRLDGSIPGDSFLTTRTSPTWPSPKFRPAVDEGSLRPWTTCGRRDERPRAQEPASAPRSRTSSVIPHPSGALDRRSARWARTREKHASCGVGADSRSTGYLRYGSTSAPGTGGPRGMQGFCVSCKYAES